MLRIFTFILLIIPFSAFAEDSDFELMARAVAFSAVADANNAYCDKDSNLATSFISKFIETKRITDDQSKKLKSLRDEQYSARLDKLKTDAKTCEDLEFMVVQLDTMRKLKDVSYRLNGVAEEDIPPDNLPDLEHFMPPKTQGL